MLIEAVTADHICAGIEGQAESKFGPALARHTRQLTAVRARQRPGDRQPQSGAPMVAGASGIQAHESLEYSVALGAGHSGPGVSNGHFRGVVARAEIDVDCPARGRVSSGVVQQIGQDLRQPSRIRSDCALVLGRSV